MPISEEIDTVRHPRFGRWLTRFWTRVVLMRRTSSSSREPSPTGSQTSRWALVGSIMVTGLLTAWPASADPRLVIEPPIVKAGDPTYVHGYGFCGRPSCSEIEIFLDGALVGGDIRPARDGTFSARIDTFADPGQHEILATQSMPDKREGLRVTGELILGVGARQVEPHDQRPEPPGDLQ